MKVKMQQNLASADYHKKDRWFMATKILLTLAPVLAIVYLQLAAGSGNIPALLRQNPEITVTFLASMMGPFAAYLLGFAQQHLYEGDVPYMMGHLLLIFFAEAMLRNGVYMILFLYLMYLVYQMTGVSPLAGFRQKWGNHFWRDLSGCFVLLLFSGFCLFVSIRLGTLFSLSI